MKKSTSLAFLACVLLFFIAVSAASPLDEDEHSVHDKRTEVCPQQYKRNVLGKRTVAKKCPCALATAIFEGTFVGLVVYTQDECGTTTLTGYFSKGFDDPTYKYTFDIVDDCGTVLHSLGTLDAVFADGGTKPFSKKFTEFNLNCDKNGILLTKSAKSDYYKRNYCPKPYYKRQGTGGGYMRVNGSGGSNASASINGA